MGWKWKEKFVEQWIIGIIILSAIIYVIITVLFWFIVIGTTCLLVFLAYLITTEIEWFKNRLWATISAYFLIFILIWVGGSEILANYGRIDKSFRETSIEWVQNAKLYKSNRGNYKVTPDYENIAEKITPAPNTQNTGSENPVWKIVDNDLHKMSNPQK